jgi:hypothetical protein
MEAVSSGHHALGGMRESRIGAAKGRNGIGEFLKGKYLCMGGIDAEPRLRAPGAIGAVAQLSSARDLSPPG